MTATTIEFTELLGRRVRMGTWEDQKISTYRKILEAIDEGRWDDAAQLESYFVDEASVCFAIYRQWIPDVRNYLLSHDVDPAIVADRDAQAIAVAQLPDGSAWDPRRQWDRLLTDVQAATAATYRQQADAAKEQMAVAKETWRRCHDRDVDHVYGLMSLVKEQLGEPAIRDMYDVVLLPLFAWRYAKFDIDRHPWDEALEVLMLVACEAMRGHLVGPERTGDMELVEFDDRFELRFDPCGSGQRTVRGDWVEGTPPRMEPPYGWTVVEGEYPWTHYKSGVCHYCVHCIVLMEEMPIDRFGYPVRVIDPPTYPDTDRDPSVRQQCKWTMYKDPTAVPEEVYARVGRVKPTAFGSRAQGARDLPVINVGMPGAG